MKHFKYLILLLISLFSFSVISQTTQLGLNPSSTKWKQIKTDKARIVFPTGIERQAQRVANLVHFMSDSSTVSIGERNRSITIFLQNQTTIPNGFVSSAPFRSEFYMTPPQFNFNGSGDWLDLLTIHEYRHVQQLVNGSRGITNFARLLFGQNMWGAVYGTAMPRWYREGDAVITETVLSESGRGRTPSFDKEYRALVLSGKKYDYEKASAGSMRDFIPSHYNQGYYMLTYARKKFGNTIWRDVRDDAAKYKGLFFPFSRNLKKRTGLTTKKLYKETLEDLKKTWAEEDSKQVYTNSKKVEHKKKKVFTNYRNPHYYGKDILVEKTGFQDIRKIYKIDRLGEESLVAVPGFNIAHNNTLSVSNTLIVWSEIGYDPRWINKNYSIIKTFNLISGKKKKITSKTKYFAPALSHDASKIVVSESLETGKNALVIISPIDGVVIQTLSNTDNNFFSFPRWTDDDKSIVVVAQRDNKQALLKIDISTGNMTELLPFDEFQITNPFPINNKVYFSSNYSGVDNIYAISLNEGSNKVFKVTNTRLGAYQPSVSVDGSSLLYSEFTIDGYDLRELKVNESEWEEVNFNNNTSTLNYYEPIVKEEGGSILERMPEKEYEITKYKKYNLFGGRVLPHSWQPNVSPPNFGIDVITQNKLTTLAGSAGYSYNVNEEKGEFVGSIAYGEFYPQLEVEFKKAERSSNNGLYKHDQVYKYRIPGTVTERDTILTGASFYSKVWDEQDLAIGVALPLRVSGGNHFASLKLSAKYHFIKGEYQQRIVPLLDGSQEVPLPVDNNFNALEFKLRFFRQRNRAVRQVNPRFAQYVEVGFRKSQNNPEYDGKVFHFNSTFYFPGILKTHSSYVSFNYQKENFLDNYQFRNNLFYSRGFGIVIHDRLQRFSFNYAFPLVFPDIAVGPFAFIKKVNVNLFFDTMTAFLDPRSTTEINLDFRKTTSNEFTFFNTNTTYSSAGTEVTFDFRAIRLLDIELGVRYSYLLNRGGLNLNRSQLDFLLIRIGA